MDDFKVPISLSDFDNMTNIRIQEIMDLQQDRLKIRLERAEAERKKREREEARKQIMRK